MDRKYVEIKNIEGLNQQGSLRQAYLGSLMEQMASLAQGNEELGIPGIFDQTYFAEDDLHLQQKFQLLE